MRVLAGSDEVQSMKEAVCRETPSVSRRDRLCLGCVARKQERNQ